MSDVDAILDTLSAQWRESPEFRSRFVSWLSGVGLIPSRRARVAYRAGVAASILKTYTTADAQAALRERFGISRATAYRDIDHARNLQQGKLFD